MIEADGRVVADGGQCVIMATVDRIGTIRPADRGCPTVVPQSHRRESLQSIAMAQCMLMFFTKYG